jgi:lipoprotein-anchoring transpeptidase ErfK/SrfK
VYDTPDKPRSTIANVRRGDVLPARRADTDRTCYDNGRTGHWWAVPGGFICSTSDFTLAEALAPLEPPQRRPAVNMPLPFRYARITKDGAPRWARKPSASELDACADLRPGDATPPGVIECMWDDFFVALDHRDTIGEVELLRTVYGEWVRADHAKILETPPLIGERIDAANPLPIAFVHGADEVDLYCAESEDAAATRCGVAERYARFTPRGFTARDGRSFVRGPDDALVPSEHVRVVRSRNRAPGVQPGEKWVHIDLANQSFVAYEGDEPVYASLISSGKPGHDTPTGLYRVQRKYLSKIMRGHDPKEGIYHVEEVPWTTYYYGTYAVHGAYWHNTFGAVRSHGCTNVAPADARWLYYWGEPRLKPQFHAQVKEHALALYFTRDD